MALVRSKSSSSIHVRTEDKLPYQKITQAFLRSITEDPLGCITFLDLSFCDIKRIQGLGVCVNLEVAILQGNFIDTLIDVSMCPHLWKLNVSCNELKDLAGFEKFKSFGTLIASGNQLDWLELSKISHLEIISLYLLGNPKLKKDLNYRRHVIKCLPKAWSLDGELVTAEERAKVDYFFCKSAKSQKPVRLKLPSRQFVPTFMKDGSTSNIYGRRTVSFSMHFGMKEVHNHALDQRRLKYISKNLNDDTNLESCLETNDLLQHCFEMRTNCVEKGNMFLLLLVSSLIFAIPKVLLTSCLEVIGMSGEEIDMCIETLKLQLQTRTNIASTLFSAIKLEGLTKGVSVRLYDTLRSLNYRLVEVAYGKSDIDVEAKYHHVIASEIAHLFCLVPDFTIFLEDPSVISILSSATLNPNIEHDIHENVCKCDVYKSKERLLELITLQVKQAKQRSLFVYSNYFKEPRDGLKGLNITYYEARKSQRPSTAPLLRSRSLNASLEHSPAVGEKVLLGPQRLAHIVSVPDTKVLLVQVHSLPSSKHLQADYQESSETTQSLFYINREDLQWNQKFMSWVMESKLNKLADKVQSKKSHDQRPRLVLQRVKNFPSQRSKSSCSTNDKDRFTKQELSISNQTLLDLRSSHNFKDIRIRNYGIETNLKDEHIVGSQSQKDSSSSKMPTLSEGDFTEYPGQYRVLQGNVYHLFESKSRSTQMPVNCLIQRPQTSYSKRSDNMFIRRSNWPKTIC
ncbi:uncharacterized protein LOC135694004 [Rhopilema esculentum]|uniref:uncharacterized protein LOC135694004 n=1 Tax=Rhopilema esculentum TaxID=499914 RepID=UPI0031CF8623|eukprot:gene10872-19695_t